MVNSFYRGNFPGEHRMVLEEKGVKVVLGYSRPNYEDAPARV